MKYIYDIQLYKREVLVLNCTYLLLTQPYDDTAISRAEERNAILYYCNTVIL